LISQTISKIKCESAEGLNAIYLTFDIDWAHDEILEDTIDLVEMYKSLATWFVTHATPLLGRLRNNPDFELGIYPNFNFLLDGDNRAGKNAEEVLDRLLTLVPEAKCVRSHSLTQSSRLIDMFSHKRFTHECNTFIPANSGIALKPWSSFCGLTRVPYFWEDDVHMFYDSIGISQPNPAELATAGGAESV